ncbi:hypothetical protein chiPu_0027131, partial [Chiloscyllium punctatum]|nr:hypothetical protein [Chiloscyllium punctatum]
MSQRDVPTNAEGSSAEESVMMERCRKLFMMKFQSNASRYSSQDGESMLGPPPTPGR